MNNSRHWNSHKLPLLLTFSYGHDSIYLLGLVIQALGWTQQLQQTHVIVNSDIVQSKRVFSISYELYGDARGFLHIVWRSPKCVCAVSEFWGWKQCSWSFGIHFEIRWRLHYTQEGLAFFANPLAISLIQDVYRKRESKGEGVGEKDREKKKYKEKER